MRMTKAVFLTLALLGACAEQPVEPAPARAPTSAHAHASSPLTAEDLAAVAAVRRATARYHDFTLAVADGYADQWPAGCAASPEGAQAFHYRNPDLVDGSVDLLRPELLMYEPGPNGTLSLIGVDYYIPFELWTEDSPPELLGRPMARNEALGIWAMHIWAWRPNPSGLFAPWNPKVSCAYAR